MGRLCGADKLKRMDGLSPPGSDSSDLREATQCTGHSIDLIQQTDGWCVQCLLYGNFLTGFCICNQAAAPLLRLLCFFNNACGHFVRNVLWSVLYSLSVRSSHCRLCHPAALPDSIWRKHRRTSHHLRGAVSAA